MEKDNDAFGGDGVRGLDERELRRAKRAATRIDPLNLQAEYIRLPGDLAHWNARYADALEAYLEAEALSKRTEAELYISLREVGEQNGRMTEATLRASIEAHPRWQAAKIANIEAEVEKQRARGMVDAIHAKKEMLISLGAHVRKEMENNPKLREQSRHVNDRDG